MNYFTDLQEKYDKAIYEQDEVSIAKNWTNGDLDEGFARKFTAYMQSAQGPASIGFAKKFDLEKRFGVKSFMDVGAGSGCFW